MAIAYLQTERTLLTRGEVARHLGLSPREWDRVRKVRRQKHQEFTELHIIDGHKGLRFLAVEVDRYIRERIEMERSAFA